MNQLEKIKEGLLPLLLSHDIELYDITWTHEGKHKILQIAIMHPDGSMDIDDCATMAELISAKLDEMDLIDHEYMLEVCSPGAERVLRTYDEVTKEVGNYLYAKFKEPVGKLTEVKGTLSEVVENELCFDYMDKAVKKKCRVSYDNIALIRLSVKI